MYLDHLLSELEFYFIIFRLGFSWLMLKEIRASVKPSLNFEPAVFSRDKLGSTAGYLDEKSTTYLKSQNSQISTIFFWTTNIYPKVLQ
jgi:hypothetical protein